uniref:Ectonucleotide pyrophosphatase/phosphodiesterase n=1 Tax=Prevotella sp. GTC17262 TaxID=3236797 RepID=A0AB33JNT9_9BACT
MITNDKYTDMKKLLITLTLCLAALTCMAGKHYTVIVSLDGFRWDYPEWYDTPNLDTIAAKGVTSGLIPSFPSKTFPNHYTIATGLYPDHHGIVHNTFFDDVSNSFFSLANMATKLDPHFYGGEPIWVTARRQGVKTSVFYWPGSDVKVKGMYPDRYLVYDKEPRLTFGERVESVLSELRKPEGERPQLIMTYFEQPDAHGHHFGPHSKKTRQVVMQTDTLMGLLYRGIQQLPFAADINLIIVSDHGMTWVDEGHQVPLKSRLKASWVKSIQGNVPAMIYAREGCADSIYQALRHIDYARVWKRSDVPAYLHYGTNPRIGDIVVCPDAGYLAQDSPVKGGGTHGFDPTVQDMHALFRAVGPDFPHTTLPHFCNVDVYPLLCKLLDIIPAPNDGTVPAGL